MIRAIRWARERFAAWITPGKWVVIATTANIISTGIFLYASAHVDEAARRHNCEQVIDAFDAYTRALAEVSGAAESTVRDFQAAYQPELSECR